MHEAMLKVINLHWFHNDASERNDSLNGNSNKPQINEWWLVISCQIKSPWCHVPSMIFLYNIFSKSGNE